MCDSREFCRSSRDSTIGINFDALGDVEHFEHVSGDFFDLFKSGEHADVTFLISGVKFPAHRIILAARCTYFKVLLFGEMKEAHPGAEIPIYDTTAEAFGTLLEYIYSGRICLGDLADEVILDVLGLTNKYDFAPLQQALIAYLKATLNVNNACLVYNVASFYQLKDLSVSCHTFVDMHAPDVMKSDGFLSLSQSALIELIARDSFFAPEMDIYQGIVRWMNHNNVVAEQARDLLKVVRLQLIPLSNLLREIRKSGMFDPNDILDAIAMIDGKPAIDLEQRGLLIPEENVATPQRDACTIEGQVKDVLLNGDTENYSGEQGYTTHTITRDNSKGITVQLNHPYIINCIRMLLWDRDNRSYSYFVQVSLDSDHWVKVVDRTVSLCRSWQELFFEPRVVRYVRIIGVHNTMNRSFHLVSCACLYSSKSFQLSKDGFIIPTENVANISASATVLEGVSRSRNALLNGNTRDYDWDSGYTCHQLGSGCIIVQLAQPYIISSMSCNDDDVIMFDESKRESEARWMGGLTYADLGQWGVFESYCSSPARLLLWDCDDRTYSYYIDVSTDQNHWTRVVDKSQEATRSWQVVQFDPLLVTFIKIVGTHNTANEVFHVVHFECPASTLPALKQSLV